MAIRFYLDNRPNKVGEHPIRVSVCVKGTKLISTIGHSVTPEVWADDTVIKPKYTNSKGTSGKQINADIMRLKAHFSEYEINLTDRPAKMELHLLLTASLKRDSAINLSGKTTALFKHLDRFISEESLAGQWAYSTIRCWNTFRGHLAKFNPFITYDCFDEDGINQFLAFLRYEQKLTEKTVKKIYTHLKWFLGWAIRKRL
ncbi:MAG: phage integrase SAM-like domain-containing protein, partial [Bacteroidales bacterium]|nr:phage integrase SAM-like domain-containing protein [Bacteroidales bacterium]